MTSRSLDGRRLQSDDASPRLCRLDDLGVVPVQDEDWNTERTAPPINVAMKGGVRSKNDQRLGTRFFEPGGYKIEPPLANR